MTNTKLRKLTRDLMLSTARVLMQSARVNLENDRALAPAAVLLLPDGSSPMIGLEFSNQAEKQERYQYVRALASSNDALGVVLINDVRKRTVQKGEDTSHIQPGDIANDTTAQEAICVQVISPLFRHGLGLESEYTRSSDGAIVWGKPSEIVGTRDQAITTNLVLPWWS